MIKNIIAITHDHHKPNSIPIKKEKTVATTEKPVFILQHHGTILSSKYFIHSKPSGKGIPIKNAIGAGIKKAQINRKINLKLIK